MSEFATHRKELLSDWDKFSLWFSTAPSCSRCERLSLPGAMPNSKKNVGCSSCLDKKVACPRKSSYLFDLTKDSFFSSWAEFDKAEDALKIRKFRATRSAQNPIPGPLPLPLPVPFSVSLPLPSAGTAVSSSDQPIPGPSVFSEIPDPGLFTQGTSNPVPSFSRHFWRDATPTRRYHDQPPSPLDKPGSFYDFVILDDNNNNNNNNNNVEVVKFGRTAHPTKCPWQWARQCKGQHQHWQYRWEVLFAAKFVSTWRLESLIHEHFKHAGAWLGPSKCGFCPVSHLEKYNYRRCGGRDAVVEVVETYLRRLRWVIVSTMHGVWIMPRRGEFIGLPGFEGINTLARVVYSAQTEVAEPPSSPANLAFQVFPNTRSSGPSRHMCLYRACKNYMWDHWRTEPLLRASGPWDQERQDEASGPRGETCRPSDEIVGPSTGSSRHAICSPDSGAGLGLGLAGGGWYDWGPHVHPGRTRRTASSSSPGSSSCWVYALGASGLCGGAASRLSLSFGAVVEGGRHVGAEDADDDIDAGIPTNADASPAPSLSVCVGRVDKFFGGDDCEDLDFCLSFGGHGGLGRGSAHSLPSHSLRIQLCISLAPMQAALFVTSRSNPACLQCPTVPTLHAQVHAHIPRPRMSVLSTREKEGNYAPVEQSLLAPSGRTPTCACRRVRILLCVRRPPPRAAIKLDPDVGVECVDPAAPVEAGTVGKAVRFAYGVGPVSDNRVRKKEEGCAVAGEVAVGASAQGIEVTRRPVASRKSAPKRRSPGGRWGASEGGGIGPAGVQEGHRSCLRVPAKGIEVTILGFVVVDVEMEHALWGALRRYRRGAVYWRLPSVVLAPTEQGTSARGAAYWAGAQRAPAHTQILVEKNLGPKFPEKKSCLFSVEKSTQKLELFVYFNWH
ncbi:hypothetical protein B0H17DRAFT_1299626 [Mycena rosella]|uniref:Uncharacterized protein n=1 Tax=Mycena rosella TaxID=1033263 RepID=A0AAD7FFJ2_MYCRO|nr:hypothetical protein B0H17DRAFT_1299626 [Mycena rosella]